MVDTFEKQILGPVARVVIRFLEGRALSETVAVHDELSPQKKFTLIPLAETESPLRELRPVT